MTQGLNQSIRDVPLWSALPMDVFRQVVEMKRKSQEFTKPTNPDEFKADPYTEENWLKQYGDII